MKKIYSILFLFFWAFMIACTQEEEIVSDGNTGYLRLDVSTEVTTTKSGDFDPENYKPKQFYVAIHDADGKVVRSTEDFEKEWAGQKLKLEMGIYTIKVHSNGFDGSVSGEDLPFYAGETTVTVSRGKEVTANIKCKLANVKVTVNFDSSFGKTFKAAEVSISSLLTGVEAQDFKMGTAKGAVYFPEGDIVALIRVTNFEDNVYIQRDTIENVKANDHYIFNYKVKLVGEGDVQIEVDESESVYTFTFELDPTPKTTLEADTPIPGNVWSSFVHVTGKIKTKESDNQTFDNSSMYFEYQEYGDEDWEKVQATSVGGDAYKAKLTGLKAATSYKLRLAYRAGNEEYVSGERSFTTDIVTVLPNGDMENWTQDGKTIDLGGGVFWDSSNPGTTTGAGAIVNVNPTQGVSSPKHGGSKAAQLKSQFASAVGIGKFAAASLYAGAFYKLVGTNGARLDWGRPFIARPTQLKGWYQYTTGKVDYDGDGPLSKNDNDLWSAQVVLVDLGSANYVRVDNTDMSTFPDWNTDSRVIAYGKLSDDFCKQQKTNWTQFVIDLDYKNLTKKPTHIIIVFSSSKYGDYFEGSTSSLLYLDDLEFVYGEPNF